MKEKSGDSKQEGKVRVKWREEYLEWSWFHVGLRVQEMCRMFGQGKDEAH